VKTSKLLLLATLLTLAAIPAAAQVNDTYVIPVSANLRGAFGTHWLTRFSIFNPHLNYGLNVSLTFLPTGGATGDEVLIEIPPNALFFSPNILEEAFGVTSGSGSLLVAAFAEDNPGVSDTVLALSFLVSTDTFNNHPSGTYGQTIPGVWAGLLDYDRDPISAVAHGIRNSGVWRTNIGAVNLGSCQATLLVSVYDIDGNTILNEAPFTLPPYGHMQDRLPVSVNNGSVEFFVADPCADDNDRFAVVFPYTSTIDQRSGDAAYQSPTLLAEPDVLYAKGQKIDPLAVGKKIDASYAKKVRAHANRLGSVKLTRQENGWQIAK
jgi:hypothetical protein